MSSSIWWNICKSRDATAPSMTIMKSIYIFAQNYEVILTTVFFWSHKHLQNFEWYEYDQIIYLWQYLIRNSDRFYE